MELPGGAGRLISGVDQIGVVVVDLDQTITELTKLGVRGWTIRNVPLYEEEVRGKPERISFRLGIAQMGAVQIELIEPGEGNSIYREHLQTKGEGLQHLGLVVPDKDERVRAMMKLGINVLQGGLGEHPAAYMDTTKTAGIIFEFIGATPKLIAFFEKVKQKSLEESGVN